MSLSKILSKTMLPFNFVYKWQDKIDIEKPQNITKIECENSIDELNVVIDIIKKHKNNIAVITTSDSFANQLETALFFFNLPVYNAFGNKFSKLESIKYIFLIVDAIKSNFDTIQLLSLLKHGFTLFGYDNKNDLDNLILKLEDDFLRKDYKIIDYKKYDIDIDLREFIYRILSLSIPLSELNIMLSTHIDLALKIAPNIFDDKTITFLNELINESITYGQIKDLNEYLNILDYLIAENSFVDTYTIHPTITIISPQESRLLNFDFVILTNCNDDTFPPHLQADPWMSKQMRKDFKLPAKEEIIGQFAFDFCQILSNKKVVITRAIKEDGLTTISSKFLLKLETFLKCQNTALNTIFYKNEILSESIKIERPNPKPPIELRPTELYVTDIEKLIKNPYNIYAKKILNLKKKPYFNENKIFLEFGNAAHEVLDKYTKNYSNIINNKSILYEYCEKIFAKYFVNESSKNIFLNKFERIMEEFIKEDKIIRDDGYEISSETIESKMINNIKISAKIDRIENKNGIINIIDYKTGIVPSQTEVESGKKIQLIVEAILLGKIDKLIYWSIKEKNDLKIKDIKRTEIKNIEEIIEKTKNALMEMILYFNNEKNGYICSYDDIIGRSIENDYRHLSRVDEWGYY
jgi:ATP-dependent helicase/nuclease subunit B